MTGSNESEMMEQLKAAHERKVRQEVIDLANEQKLAAKGKSQNVLELLHSALSGLQSAKPEDRSELARRYAVTITELEKVIAYYWLYVCNAE